MTTFVYTASDSIQAHHVLNEQYSIELAAQRAPKKRTVSRTIAESISGVRETLKHYGKRGWTITFAPIMGSQIPAMDEFLDSIEDGQQFSVWLYGEESAPVIVYRLDEGHSFEEFMPVGSAETDWFTVSGIEIREA